MTAPASASLYGPLASPYDQAPPPVEPTHPVLDAATELAVVVLATWLASSVAVRAVTLPADIVAAFQALGLNPRAILAAGRMALSVPVAGRHHRRTPSLNTSPSAASVVADDEARLRALYVLNAARRLSVSLAGGVDPVTAFSVERRNLESSQRAARNRARAAAAVDEAAQISPWLEWRCRLDPTTGRPDDRVTPDCRAMNGQLFTLDSIPAIGLPGAVHPQCRCKAAPFGSGLFGALPTISATSPTGVR